MGTSPIIAPIGNHNDYYLDMLESGEYMVSKLDTKIKVFAPQESKEAIFFYLTKVYTLDELIPELNDVSEQEAMEYLENQLRPTDKSCDYWDCTNCDGCGCTTCGGSGYIDNELRQKFAKANADLIVEAGTVYHQFGITPRQLLEQRNDLINTLKYCLGGLPVDDELKDGEARANVHKIRMAIIKQLKKFDHEEKEVVTRR
jgi:hypothetical protein